MHMASTPMNDPTRRFSSRVENYVRYRPSYPGAAIDLLEAECGLGEQSVIAMDSSSTSRAWRGGSSRRPTRQRPVTQAMMP